MDRRDFLQAGVMGAAGGAQTRLFEVAEASIPTIQGLRDASVEPGRVLYVRGRDAIGDGGGGFFVWNETRAPKTFDGGTGRAQNALWVHSQQSDAGHWFRIWDETAVDVRWFGAHGDGKTNDGPAIQDAVYVAGYLGVKKTHLPEGTYRTEIPLVLQWTSGQVLEGQGSESTEIIRTGTEQYTTRRGEGSAEVHAAIVVPVGKTGDAGYADSRGVTVRNLRLRQDEIALETQYGRKNGSSKRYGIFVEKAYHCTFENLRIDGFHTSLYSGKLWMSEIHNIRTTGCVDFLHIAGGDDRSYSASSTSLQISNCYCSNKVLRDGFILSKVFYSSIQNCGADKVEGWPYRIRMSRGITLTGCGFEGSRNGKGILFEGAIGVVSGCKAISPHPNTKLDEQVSTLSIREFGGIQSEVTVLGSHFNNLMRPVEGELTSEQVDMSRNAKMLVTGRSRVVLIGSRITQNANPLDQDTEEEQQDMVRVYSGVTRGGSERFRVKPEIPELDQVSGSQDLDAINHNFELLRDTIERLAEEIEN